MKFRLLFLLLIITSTSQAQDTLPIYRKLAEIAVIDQKVMIPMRDGVRLATDIYRPKDGGKHPLILSRTPYNFNSWVDGKMTSRAFEEAYEAVKRGYAYAVQNERGCLFGLHRCAAVASGLAAMASQRAARYLGRRGSGICQRTQALLESLVSVLDQPQSHPLFPGVFYAVCT